MKCCEICFVNESLREIIRENDQNGDCEFCGSKDVFTIEASELNEAFAALLGLYEPVQYGEHFHPEMNIEAMDVGEQLSQAIQEDWGDIFNYEKLDIKQQCDILDEIRDGSGYYDYKDPSTPSGDLWASKEKSFSHVSEDELWYGFCNHIKHDRRFILKPAESLDPIADPKEWLPRYLSDAKAILASEVSMYRARLNPREETDAPLGAEQMSAPPKEIARAGRVNPPGIPMLYAAMEKATAVAEVRPETGATMTIARIMTKKPISIVDLTTVPPIPDPFACGEETLASAISRNAFLRCLNTSLSVPVRREDADIEYIPTQYVAEVIRNAGYDGIIYASSLAAGGKNIVVFDPKQVIIDSATELIAVTAVSVSYEEKRATRLSHK